MSNIGNFKRVGREVVYKGKILEFCQDEIQTSKGHHVTWDFLNHKGAAAIVPVMDDGKILMVKQWRNVVNRVSLEIPAGAKDTVEEPTLECATRELEEETGYKPGRMEFLHTIVPATLCIHYPYPFFYKLIVKTINFARKNNFYCFNFILSCNNISNNGTY